MIYKERARKNMGSMKRDDEEEKQKKITTAVTQINITMRRLILIEKNEK